jgi:glycerophosphoryl diester phosphodiesterase
MAIHQFTNSLIHQFTDSTKMVPLRPLVYAHRGGAALRPENTIASFDNGLSLGADGLEFDVRLSRDGVVVVHHDATLERTTNGRGSLASCTADELAHVDAGYWFTPADTRTKESDPPSHPYRGQGHGVPRLQQVLSRYPGVPLIIELKVNDPELARRTIQEVRAANAVDRVAIGSFGWRVLRTVRALEPAIPTGASREEVRLALYRSWVRWPLGKEAYREFQVPERSGPTRVVSRNFIRHAHRVGLPVKVWTVNDPADMRRLLEWGVDALISDRPDLAVSAISAHSRV